MAAFHGVSASASGSGGEECKPETSGAIYLDGAMAQKKDRATERLEEALSGLEKAMESATRVIADAIQGLRRAVGEPPKPARRGKKGRRG